VSIGATRTFGALVMLALCSAWGKPMKPNQFVQKAFNRVVADTKSIIEEGKYQKIASNNYDYKGTREFIWFTYGKLAVHL
jgi:hypothetical protein